MDNLNSKSRSELLENRVADFRDQNFIPWISEGHENNIKALVDAVLNSNVINADGVFWFI